MPIVLAVDVGKFELSEESMVELHKLAADTHKLLQDGSDDRGRVQYRALFDWLRDKGIRISLVDPRPVDLILPSPNLDFELLRRIFVNRE